MPGKEAKPEEKEIPEEKEMPKEKEMPEENEEKEKLEEKGDNEIQKEEELPVEKGTSEKKENIEEKESPEELNERDLKFIQGYWKLPAITQFIQTFHPLLGINEITPTEFEQWILRPDIDGTMGILMNSLLQKSSNIDPKIPNKLTHRPGKVYHIPILNDMNDYQIWNDKLAKKMTNLHKLYKRFLK